MATLNPKRWLEKRIESTVQNVVSKVSYPTESYAQDPRREKPEPPYERKIHPRWIYKLRQNSTLVNNAIEEKVSQTFRRGFTEWEKEYKAKCENCSEEFQELGPFFEQLGQYGQELNEEDLDLSERECPECGEVSEFKVPKESDKEAAEDFFRQVNEKTEVKKHLEPMEQNSVGQTFLGLCKEIAWDIQSFDDGWMLFEREYKIDEETGTILGYDLKGIHRAPPELMRYSVDENGNFGGEYWVCPKCRRNDDYEPEKEPIECTRCGAHTYQVYAYSMNEPSGEPQNFYIRGEFVHASEYEPSKYYGYSPILTLWEEARTIELMDEWYKDAYEERRAPRGAMLIRSSNAESVRAFNQGQMEKLRNDEQHIPTFIDDTEGRGKALEWVSMLEDPAEMQHMEMRNWFLDRISAKYGVTSVFQKGSPNNTGLSQSLEIVVSNRSADRLRNIFNTTFIPAVLGQIETEGWTRELKPVEEEDEAAQADVQGKFVQNAKRAKDVGLDFEWTEDDKLNIFEQKVDADEDGEAGPDGATPVGPEPDDGPDPGGANATGGAPGNQAPGAGPRLENTDNSVTTGDGGYSNSRYGGSGETINIMEHLRSIVQEESEKKEKSVEEMTWREMDIREIARIWVEDPENAPVEANVKEATEGPTDYYYEEHLSTVNVNKADYIDKNAFAVDFLKETDDYGEREYVDSPDEAPDDVQVYESDENPGVYFYYVDEHDGESDEERYLDGENINELSNTDVINNHEAIDTDINAGDLDYGDDIIYHKQQSENWHTIERYNVIDEVDGTWLLQDEEGHQEWKSFETLDSLDTFGKVVEDPEAPKFHDGYQKPSDLWDTDNVTEKKNLSVVGGINEGVTKEVHFDNGEKAIYKYDNGVSYEGVLDSDAVFYEVSEVIDADLFVPETAKADLKNGLGSAMKWVDDAPKFQAWRSSATPDEQYELFNENKEQVADMAFMDFLINNSDRHGSNFLLTGEDDPAEKDFVAIDNGGHAKPPKDFSWGPMRSGILRYAKGAMRAKFDDESEFEEALEDYLDDIFDIQRNKMEQLLDNKEEIESIVTALYGEDNDLAERWLNGLSRPEYPEDDDRTRVERDFDSAEDNVKRILQP